MGRFTSQVVNEALSSQEVPDQIWAVETEHICIYSDGVMMSTRCRLDMNVSADTSLSLQRSLCGRRTNVLQRPCSWLRPWALCLPLRASTTLHEPVGSAD